MCGERGELGACVPTYLDDGLLLPAEAAGELIVLGLLLRQKQETRKTLHDDECGHLSLRSPFLYVSG